MGRRIVSCVSRRLIRVSVACALLVLSASPAFAQSAFSATGTLVISGGGNNTQTIKYTGFDIAKGDGSAEIKVSAAYPTVVIRGPKLYLASCATPGECWEGDSCFDADYGASRLGVCGIKGSETTDSCVNEAAASARDARQSLDACALAWARSKRGVVSADIGSCLEAGKSVAKTLAYERDQGQVCSGDRLRNAVDQVVFDVLAGSQQGIAVTTNGAGRPRLDQANLAPHLNRINQWYTNYLALYPADIEKVWAALSRVSASFWKTVYDKVVPSGSISDYAFRDSLEADRTALLALLKPAAETPQSLPVSGPPFVQLLGDGLHSMSGRLNQVGMYHDLACRFRNNPPSLPSCAKGQLRTEITELIRLLAAIPAAGEVQSVLQGASGISSTNWENWTDVFEQLADSTPSPVAVGVLRQAVVQSLPGVTDYSPDLIAPPKPVEGARPPSAPQVTPPLVGLAGIVQKARIGANSYEQTGLYNAQHQRVLTGGVHAERTANVISDANSRVAEVRRNIETFAQARQTKASAILQGMANLGNQDVIRQRITELLSQDQQLRADLAGLRHAAELLEAHYGDFMQRYNGVTALTVTASDTTVDPHQYHASVSAADAVWLASGSGTDLAEFVAPAVGVTWPLQFRRGDIVNITTTGTWAPTCALRTVSFPPVKDDGGKMVQFKPPENAQTGPEGYLLSVSANSFTASSNTRVHSEESYDNTTDLSRKVCAGIRAEAGNALKDVFGYGAEVYAYTEVCKGYDEGYRESDSTSGSGSSCEEQRMSAAFSSGLRVPGTPFPMFPVGSLLLVQVQKGGTDRNNIVDVRVLQAPYSSIIITDDVDIYLAVNDFGDCRDADTRQLTLNISSMTPTGTLVKNLGQGMGAALADLRSKQGFLLEQGRIGPQQMAELKSAAYTKLVSACGESRCTSFSYYPEALRTFFETWLDKELAALERRVDVRTIERQLELIRIQLAGLANDLENAEDQAGLLVLIPTWLLKDLDTVLLEANTTQLLNIMLGDVHPIVEIKYPSTFERIDAAQLGRMTSLDWTSNLVDSWAPLAADLASNILTELGTARAGEVDGQFKEAFLALGIPRDPANPPRTNLQRMAAEQAAKVWTAIDNQEPSVSITISPSDLYSKGSSFRDVLSCYQAAPVITAMALYLVRPGDAGDNPFSGLGSDVSINPIARFPDIGGEKDYRIAVDGLLHPRVPILTGNVSIEVMNDTFAENADESANPRNLAGNGISPFTQFDIQLGPIWDKGVETKAPADGAVEMVLMFRVRYRETNYLSLAPMCPP